MPCHWPVSEHDYPVHWKERETCRFDVVANALQPCMTTASHASRMRVPPNCAYVFRGLSRSRSGLRPLISDFGGVRVLPRHQSEAPSPTPSRCACPSADQHETPKAVSSRQQAPHRPIATRCHPTLQPSSSSYEPPLPT